MSISIIPEPVRQRYILIENDTVVRNGFKYKLESNFLGRILLKIFCCCCWKNDKNVDYWRDQRTFLIKNELMPDHPDYQLWYGAVRRVNKMLPMERISFRNTFQQLPSYQLRTPISRSVPPGSSTLHVNTSQSFQPMNIGQPHTSTLELNTSPFYQPASTGVSYPTQVVSGNRRPTSVGMPQVVQVTSFQQPNVRPSSVNNQRNSIFGNEASYNARPDSVSFKRDVNTGSIPSQNSRPNSVHPGQRRRGV